MRTSFRYGAATATLRPLALYARARSASSPCSEAYTCVVLTCLIATLMNTSELVRARRAKRGGNPICPRCAFLACPALHA